MSGRHTHGEEARSSPTAVRAALAVIVPLALATLAALIWMWPDGAPPSQAAPGQESVEMERVKGTITSIDLKRCPKPEGVPSLEPAPGGRPAAPDPAKCGDAYVELTSDSQVGRTVVVELPSGPGSLKYSDGDDVVLLYMAGATEGNPYQLTDHDRSNTMWLVGAAFVLAVIAFGRWRGLTALLGLAITFVLLLKFLVPAILDGQSPLLAAIVCAAAIMLTVLFLTHGFTMATSIAVIGTLASLGLTGLLSTFAIGMAHLSGVSDESSLNLGLSSDINLQGLLLAGIIIGSLGVLDDVTVTQSATVTELARANPGYGFRQLYKAATRVGRAHIASVINTIILAYAGASLPLLLMFSVGNQPLGQAITGPIIAQEIVRSVAGTLGLIAAVPITTALAAFTRTRRPGHGTNEEDPAFDLPMSDLEEPYPIPRTRRPTRDGDAPTGVRAPDLSRPHPGPRTRRATHDIHPPGPTPDVRAPRRNQPPTGPSTVSNEPAWPPHE